MEPAAASIIIHHQCSALCGSSHTPVNTAPPAASIPVVRTLPRSRCLRGGVYCLWMMCLVVVYCSSSCNRYQARTLMTCVRHIYTLYSQQPAGAKACTATSHRCRPCCRLHASSPSLSRSHGSCRQHSMLRCYMPKGLCISRACHPSASRPFRDSMYSYYEGREGRTSPLQ